MSYNVNEIEPAGTGTCTECGDSTHVWSDTYTNGEYKNVICMPCLSNKGNKYVEHVIEGYDEAYVEDKKVVFDIGYGITAHWSFTEKEVDTTKDPQKQNIIIQPDINQGGTVFYKNTKIATVTIQSYRQKAEEIAGKYYEN
jgi:hypothetical protein